MNFVLEVLSLTSIQKKLGEKNGRKENFYSMSAGFQKNFKKSNEKTQTC